MEFRRGVTRFSVELISTQNLSDVEVQIYIDGNKIGAKGIPILEKAKPKLIIFDHFFDDISYIGEHYIELMITSNDETKSSYSKKFYSIISISDNKISYLIITLVIIFVLNLLFLIFVCIKNKEYNEKVKSIIDFGSENRKVIFSLIITVLPIVASYFVSIIDNPILKMEVVPIILCFCLSYALIIYAFIKWPGDKLNYKANNYTLYSISFLFLGLIDMLLLSILLPLTYLLKDYI